MRAHQIVTRTVITIRTGTSILEAANLMLREHIGGLPVVDETGKLIGRRFYSPRRNQDAEKARPMAHNPCGSWQVRVRFPA
jgi:CBS-domain-containing membrane protein